MKSVWWITLLSLLGIATLFAVRTVIPASAKSVASEQVAITFVIPERALKADKLAVFEPSPAKLETVKIAPTATIAVAIAPTPKIISRHWHDPMASSRATTGRR